MKKGLAVLAVLPVLALARVDTMWTHQCYSWPVGGPNSPAYFNRATDIVADDNGNVYVCGMIQHPLPDYNVTCMGVVKYNQWGDSLWARTHSGDGHGYWGNDIAHALTIDDDGNIYVVGTVDMHFTKLDVFVVKYAPNGTRLWMKRWDLGEGNDAGFDIALDGNGNVYTCGAAMDTAHGLSAYLVMRIDPSNGNMIWTRRYVMDTLAFEKKGFGRDRHPSFFDCYADWENCATGLDISPDGDIVVTGFGLAESTEIDWWTMKFDPAGNRLWEAVYHLTAEDYDDVGFDVAVADSGDIYVVGFNENETEMYNFTVVEYHANGVQAGARHIDGPAHGDDFATSVALDDSSQQNVYVTGVIEYDQPGCQILTQKLSADLEYRWGNGAVYGGMDDDCGYDVCYNKGQVYVTGNSSGDLVLLCYTTANGFPKDTLWAYVYDGPDQLDDVGTAVWVTDSEHVYVGGQSHRSGIMRWSSMFIGRVSCAAGSLEEKMALWPGFSFMVVPNPLAGNGILKYSVPGLTTVAVRLYDATGRLVRTLVAGREISGAGSIRIETENLATGVYLLRLDTEEGSICNFKLVID